MTWRSVLSHPIEMMDILVAVFLVYCADGTPDPVEPFHFWFEGRSFETMCTIDIALAQALIDY